MKESMDAQSMKYERYVHVSYGIWYAQYIWSYCRGARGERIVRKKNLLLRERYKSLYRLWLIKVFKGTYNLLIYKELCSFFYCNPRGRSLCNSHFRQDCKYTKHI